MSAKSFRLSKSSYVAGLQCTKQLWWRMHEPEAPELVPDESLKAIFEQGREVGTRARGFVPGGVLTGGPEMHVAERVEATHRIMKSGAAVLYEAAVEHDGVVVIVDILEHDRKMWTLTEVKSTTSVKDEHIPDVAVQTFVMRGAGHEVRRADLMHLNRECRSPDLGNLFVRENITARVEGALGSVPGRLAVFRAALAGPLPEVAIGGHCSTPHDCPFMNRCWSSVPAHSLWSLFKLKGAKRDALHAQGIRMIAEIPESAGLTDIQLRQQRAVAGNALIVEPGLAAALAGIQQPVSYLDFETIMPAVPVWPGMHPFGQAPVQVSVHVEEDGASDPRHFDWLASGPDDPRPEMARRVIEFVPATGSVVVYNAAFEASRIEELETLLPDLAPALAGIRVRLCDLLPIVRDHVYHPDFGGSFSLKAVLPALVPGVGYADLEVAEGGAASRLLMQLIFQSEEMSETERDALRLSLLEYCKRDTLAMVLLLRRLRELAAG